MVKIINQEKFNELSAFICKISHVDEITKVDSFITAYKKKICNIGMFSFLAIGVAIVTSFIVVTASSIGYLSKNGILDFFGLLFIFWVCFSGLGVIAITQLDEDKYDKKSGFFVSMFKKYNQLKLRKQSLHNHSIENMCDYDLMVSLALLIEEVIEEVKDKHITEISYLRMHYTDFKEHLVRKDYQKSHEALASIYSLTNTLNIYKSIPLVANEKFLFEEAVKKLKQQSSLDYLMEKEVNSDYKSIL